VRAAFGGKIMLDPCSNSESVVAAEVNFLLPEHDGLEEEWSSTSNYVNPPFGRSYMHQPCKTVCFTRRTKKKTKTGKTREVTEFICPRCERVLDRKEVAGSSIADWVRKMLGTHRRLGAEVIGLIPAAVGTAHFQEFVWNNADALCFPEGRLSFEGKPAEGKKKAEVAPMDVCLPYWGNRADRFERALSSLGHVVRLDVARGETIHDRFVA
jgi:hypothetical protein